jgi:hypothetical protein
VVRSGNPDDDGKDFRVARTVRRYEPTRTWLQFIWLGLRDGLKEGIKERSSRTEKRPDPEDEPEKEKAP